MKETTSCRVAVSVTIMFSTPFVVPSSKNIQLGGKKLHTSFT